MRQGGLAGHAGLLGLVGRGRPAGRAGCFLAMLALLAGGCLGLPGRAFGQSPAPAVEFTGGYAGFVDDATIDHGVFGARLDGR